MRSNSKSKSWKKHERRQETRVVFPFFEVRHQKHFIFCFKVRYQKHVHVAVGINGYYFRKIFCCEVLFESERKGEESFS